jgi:hypothetical protein
MRLDIPTLSGPNVTLGIYMPLILGTLPVKGVCRRNYGYEIERIFRSFCDMIDKGRNGDGGPDKVLNQITFRSPLIGVGPR